MRGKSKPKRRKINFLLIIVPILFVVIGAIYAATFAMPNSETIPWYEFHEDFNMSQINIVMEDEFIETPTAPIMINNELYFPVDFIEEHISQYIFWDENLSILTITTETELMRMSVGEDVYYVNRRPRDVRYPIREQNGMAFMSVALIEELYLAEIRYSEVYNIATVFLTDKARTVASVSENVVDAIVRHEPNRRSPIINTLQAGEEVTVFEEVEDFLRVRSQHGVIGYVPVGYMTQTRDIPAIEREIVDVTIPPRYSGRLVLAWDMMTVRQANARLANSIHPEALDVLSPTWFWFDTQTLEMISIASHDYVRVAHEAGFQVWPRIIEYTPAVSRALADTEFRDYIIDRLLDYIEVYNLDGINMNFEFVPVDGAVYYLQLMRELAPLMRERESVLSIAMFVPLFTRFYNRTEIEKTVQYVMVMAYDEHHRNSTEAGPLASLNFVETGIRQTLEEVPAHKVVLCIPFYVRIWREALIDGEIQLSVRDVGMNFARRIFEDGGAEWEWQADVGNYYGRFTVIEDGIEVTYRTWLEDLRSLQLRLDMVDEFNLAGVAAWSFGLEDYNVWEILYERLK